MSWLLSVFISPAPDQYLQWLLEWQATGCVTTRVTCIDADQKMRLAHYLLQDIPADPTEPDQSQHASAVCLCVTRVCTAVSETRVWTACMQRGCSQTEDCWQRMGGYQRLSPHIWSVNCHTARKRAGLSHRQKQMSLLSDAQEAQSQKAGWNWFLNWQCKRDFNGVCKTATCEHFCI